MTRKLAEDPFKCRQPVKECKKTLFLSEGQVNRMISHAQLLQTDKDAECKLEEKRKQREACKEFAAFSKRRQAGSELKKIQYAKDVQCVRQDLDRETRIKIQRNYVLDKAYKRLYEETDRVKYFRAAKDFCEMLKQREDQVADKASQLDRLAEYDAQFLVGVLRDVDQYKDEEKEKEKINKENKKKNAENWIKQRNEVLQKKNQEILEDLRDGFFIKDEVEKEQQKMKVKAEEGKQRVQSYKKSLDNQTKDKLLLLDMRQQLEDGEDERAKLFNEAKREMELEHKKIRSELDKKKFDRRQYVADNMIDEKSALKLKEEAIMQKAILQAEDKAREEETKKTLKQAEAQEDIEQFYENAMKLKHRRKYEDKLKSFRDRRNVEELVENLQAVEDSKQKKRHQLENEAQHLQLHQIEARKTENMSNKIDALEDYLHHMRGLDEEEEMFQKYAKKVIEDCERRGINTYAMRKAARPGIECGKGPLFKDRGNIRPRYYASVLNANDLSHVKRKSEKPDTKSRLGFLL